MTMHRDIRDLEAFFSKASYAAITPEQVQRVLDNGPGFAIGYHLARAEYRVVNHESMHRSENTFITVWGHADLAEDLPKHRADGATFAEFVAALNDTAWDYLGDWAVNGLAPDCAQMLRSALGAEGLVQDRRSDRWASNRTVRDHFVFLPAPHLRVTVKYHVFPGDECLRMLVRVWDGGRQVKGVIHACAPEDAGHEGRSTILSALHPYLARTRFRR